MNTYLPILAALGIAASLSFSATAAEKYVTSKQVPNAVHEAFQKAYPSAKGIKYSEETEEGKTVYEIEFKDNGKELEAEYGADGVLMETEEAIETSELPAAVIETIKKEHPHSAVKEAEKILKPDGTLSGYEVEIVAGKKHLELEFDAGGALVKTEAEKD